MTTRNSRLGKLRSVVLFGCFAAAGGAARAEDYVVTVEQGQTNRIDAAFVSELGERDLVKRGRGVLWSSSALANYAGTITVEEGALMVSGSGDLGTAAGPTEIKSGATLIVHTGADVDGSAAANKLTFTEGFTVAGAGDAQWGAAVYQPESGFQQQRLFGGSVTLAGDTTFDMGVNAGLTGGELLMHGYRLTTRGTVCVNRSRIRPLTESAVGDIDVERGTLMLNSFVIGDFGDAAKTVTVKDGAKVYLYEAGQIPLWKLVVEEGGTVLAACSLAHADDAANYNRWGGDVVWNSTATNSVIRDKVAGLTFLSKVTGTGTIPADRGTLTFGTSIDLAGGLAVSEATVVLPSSENVYGHGGLMVGVRGDAWMSGFDQNRADTAWSYCAEGPGPQLDSSWWADTTKQGVCSRGYIWNREETNVTWQVYLGCVYENWIYMDGELVYNNKRDGWNNDIELTLTPGAHAIDVRTQANGVVGGPRAEKGDLDKLRRILPDGTSVVLKDPGNGFLFTTDTVSRAEVLLENPHRLGCLNVGAAVELDANGLPLVVDELVGATAVTNALSLRVKRAWTLAAADIADGRVLTVEAPLTFDDGVTIAVPDLDAVPRKVKYYPLAKAPSITGFPADTVIRGAKRAWRLVLNDEGTEAGLVYIPRGLAIVIR